MDKALVSFTDQLITNLRVGTLRSALGDSKQSDLFCDAIDTKNFEKNMLFSQSKLRRLSYKSVSVAKN